VKAPRWAWLAATGLGSGRLRPAPGSWGSLAAVAVWCGVVRFLLAPVLAETWAMPPRARREIWFLGELVFLALPALMAWLAVKASDRVVEETGLKDPGFIVADEWAGMWISLWPLRWDLVWAPKGSLFPILPLLVLAFLLFRLFDIWKPWPVRQIQVLPAGSGIVADDVVAGLYVLPLLILLKTFLLGPLT
jgi:phosphatidylglycerophosphatase A